MSTNTPPSSPLLNQDLDTKPWYQQLWPWILIALPGSAVVASIITVVIAVRTPVSLVEDDYYKEGLAINQSLEKQRAAEAAGLKGDVMIDVKVGTIEVELTNIDTSDLSGNPIVLKLIHPAKSSMDRETPLTPMPSGKLAGTVIPLTEGRWQVQIEPKDDSWRLVGSLPVDNDTSDKLSSALNPG